MTVISMAKIPFCAPLACIERPLQYRTNGSSAWLSGQPGSLLVVGQGACGRGVSAPAAETSGRHVCAGVLRGKARAMAEFSVRAPGGDGRRRQVAAWMGAAVVYGAAQGLSAWAARHAQGRGTRPQYEQFERPAFAPPGAVFPVVWSALNLTTATSAWLVWRAVRPGRGHRHGGRSWRDGRWPLSSAAVTCRWHSAVGASGRPLQTRRCCA
jgi:TspO/MBR family